MGNRVQKISWFWFDKRWNKLNDMDSDILENDYQNYLRNQHKCRIYHCFGDKSKALIDFNKMETRRGSAIYLNENKPKDYMVFRLKRVVN